VFNMKRLLRSTLIAVLLITLIATPTFAIDDPDSLSIASAKAYRNLAETGDMLFVVDYFIDYTIAGIPDENVTDAYLVELIALDGITVLGAVAPYTYYNSGYDQGAASIYFNATDAAALTWGVAYTVKLVGNPMLAWAGAPPETNSIIDEWNSADNQNAVLAIEILRLAEKYELAWAVNMIDDTVDGPKLSIAGMAYFANVVVSLRILAPGAFAEGSVDPIYENITYSTDPGGVITDMVGTLTAGSPLDYGDGENTIDIAVLGTFDVFLNLNNTGIVTTGTMTVTGSPVTLGLGHNTITTTGAIGNIIITVSESNTGTAIIDNLIGTPLDFTAMADAFGTTRGMVTTILYLVVCLVALYYVAKTGNRKGIMIIVNLELITGAVTGMLPLGLVLGMTMFAAIIITFFTFYRSSNA